MFLLVGLFCASTELSSCKLASYDGGVFKTEADCIAMGQLVGPTLADVVILSCLPLGGRDT